MRQTCNQNLRRIAEESALKQSVIPVFVCDSELIVALKSFGAKKKFRHPQLNSSARPYISEQACTRLLSGTKGFCTLFERNGISSYAIALSGTVLDEVYHAFVIEPQVIFLPSVRKWYLTEAFDSLTLALNELLCEPAIHIDRLELCYMRISRLCSFFAPSTPLSKTDIVRDIKGIISACAIPLSLIGGSVIFDMPKGLRIRTYCMSEQVYALTVSILVATVPLSADGRVRVSCKLSDTKDDVEITHTLTQSSEYNAQIDSIDDLIKIAPQLRLEIAALKDMTSGCGFEFDCHSSEGKLTVYYRIRGEKSDRIELASDTLSDDMADYLSSLVNDIFRAAEYDRNQK